MESSRVMYFTNAIVLHNVVKDIVQSDYKILLMRIVLPKANIIPYLQIVAVFYISIKTPLV